MKGDRMVRSSSDRSRGWATRWVLVGAGTTAAVGCIFAALLAATPLADSNRGSDAANAPIRPAACTTAVHGVVFGQSSLVTAFIPVNYRLSSGDPADFGAQPVTYSQNNGQRDPPRLEINLGILKGPLTGTVGGMSIPTKVTVQGHEALLENAASRGMPFIGVYWKQGAGHLLSVVGYKESQSVVLRVADHVHARLGGVIPLPLNPGRIISRAAAVSVARHSMPFHAVPARAKLSSWTEVLNLLPEKFFVQSGFPPTPWHPVWAVMVTHSGHVPRLVLIDAHSGWLAFTASAGDRSGWFEALTDRDPTLHHGCPGGTSARLPFGIMTRHEEAYTLRGSGGSSMVGRVRVKNIVIMKLTTISAVHYIGCTKQDCGPYDLLWPRISVTLAPPGQLLPCDVGWEPPHLRIVKPKMAKQYFSISAGNDSEGGCGPLPGWVSRLEDLAPPPAHATRQSSQIPSRLSRPGLRGTSSQKDMAAPTPCGTGESPIYFVAQLSPDGSVPKLQSDGFDVVPLSPTTAGAQSIVMVNPRKADGTSVSTEALMAEPGVQAAGGVNAQSSDPKLLSCDYRLSDRPADAPLVAAAISALASANLATAADMNSGEDAIYMVGDDPLDAADNVVTIDTSGPGYRPGPGAPIVHGWIPHIAVVDRTTLKVSEVGVLPGGSW